MGHVWGQEGHQGCISASAVCHPQQWSEQSLGDPSGHIPLEGTLSNIQVILLLREIATKQRASKKWETSLVWRKKAKVHALEVEIWEKVRIWWENAILSQPVLSQDVFNLDVFLIPVYFTCLTELKGCIFQVFVHSLWNPHITFASSIQNHRIAEQSELEGTSWDHLDQLLC